MAKAVIKTLSEEYIYPANDFDSIYDKMMVITDNDHEISSDSASWCELAGIGETYDFREGYIEIVSR
jgi:hypothetical protein